MKDITYTFKLLRVLLVLARNDALYILEQLGISSGGIKIIACLFARKSKEAKGRRLALALTKLGPSYIKLGQALSTRSDIVGDEIAAELAMLRDSLPPFPTAQAKKIIEDELGSFPFASFEETPVAAASIAQVHKATTPEGKVLAVKVLRPGIEKRFAKDIAHFRWMAEKVHKKLPTLRRLKPLEVVDILEGWMRFEMNFNFEAASASNLAELNAGDANLIIPAVDWQRTSVKVFSSEWIEGIRVSDKELLVKSGHDPKLIAQKIAHIFYTQVFRHGFFHGDLHPGNVFVDSAGRIALVDFGIMGSLSMKDRAFLARVFDAFLKEDFYKVAEIHFNEGIVPEGQSIEAFALACRSIAKPILGRPLAEISIAKLLGHLFSVSEGFQMQLQPQFLLLQKNMMLAEGIGRMLHPNANFWEIVKPLVEDWARQHMNKKSILKRRVRRILKALSRVPDLVERADKILKDLEKTD